MNCKHCNDLIDNIGGTKVCPECQGNNVVVQEIGNRLGPARMRELVVLMAD
jgi:hypothetical protein